MAKLEQELLDTLKQIAEHLRIGNALHAASHAGIGDAERGHIGPVVPSATTPEPEAEPPAAEEAAPSAEEPTVEPEPATTAEAGA